MDALTAAFPTLADAIARADEAVPPWGEDDAALAERIEAMAALPTMAALHDLAMSLRPWRKGPWALPASDGVLEIDAEWRADWKWERLVPFLDGVAGARLLDVGCGNGYYLRRLRDLAPSLLVGIDPQPKAVLQWRLAEQLAGLAGEVDGPPVAVRRWRLDALTALPGCFDVVLCAGLLYHVTDPIEALRQLWRTVAPGGRLVLETIVVPGTDPIAWTPPRRYAGARGFWALPTAPCLNAWIERAGLRATEWSEAVATTPDEQRATAWTFGPGLAAGLAPGDPSRTVEGLPAPQRIIVEVIAG